jgi:hypothetical protein
MTSVTSRWSPLRKGGQHLPELKEVVNVMNIAAHHCRQNMLDMSRNPIDSRKYYLAWMMYNFAFGNERNDMRQELSPEEIQRHEDEYFAAQRRKLEERKMRQEEVRDGQLLMF